MMMNLLIKYRFHTPMIKFIGKRDLVPAHKPTTQTPPSASSASSNSNGFSFNKQPIVLSTIQSISEKSRNIINFGGQANSKDYKSIKPIETGKSK